MKGFRQNSNITGWIVFALSMIVYYFSVERTGSLWDCGEFILGAHKLQVVHPPGAPLFILIGRFFGLLGEMISSEPSTIAFMVNLMSGICGAFTAAFIGWGTMMMGKLALVGRENEPSASENIALCAAGLVGGLSTAFISSIWFSAVEGEVYAMSTFFTAMTVWAMIKFYYLPEGPRADKWFIFSLFAAGLSVGVHLLSLLTLPALALLYYFKKYKNQNLFGAGLAMLAGVAWLIFVQKIVIVGIPTLWSKFELPMVNSAGLPVHSGIIPVLLIIGSLVFLGLRYAHKRQNQLAQLLIVAATLTMIGFSTIGVVVIRANANTPVNMNNPSDVFRLLPYINREQYGERALINGPDFTFDGQPKYDQEERYGLVNDDHYEIVDYKLSTSYKAKDKSFFPRMSDNTMGRPKIYRQWINKKTGKPTFGDNLGFFFNYQIGWMYVRYFMWNFVGRQNGTQGFYNWDEKDGNWLSGIGPIDSARLYNQSSLPETIKNNFQRNTYYFIPFILGLLGMIFHFSKKKKDFLALLVLFIITGIGIIVYTNQPPNEPRERDYVLVGSFFTYCMWLGMGVLFLFQFIRTKIAGNTSAIAAGAIGLAAPLLLVTQNFDDHSRMNQSGSRDYANNFLESCDPNAIIFTYGDNDTYPLWYAQEIEGIRTDVRVCNLSLINVDWYIDQMRRKVNDSPPIKMSIPAEAYRGHKRLQIPVRPSPAGQYMDSRRVIAEIARDSPNNNGQEGNFRYYGISPASKLILPIDRNKAIASGLMSTSDTMPNPRIEFNLNERAILRGDMAIIDMINQNIYDRPIYFSVTSQQEKLLGLNDFMQLEGLGLKLIPIKTPSDRNFGIYGSGRVAPDKILDRVKNKFKWGGFDKEKMFVNHSYGPSLSAHRMIMWKALTAFVENNEAAKAEELSDTYFKAFPHMNFPYDGRTVPFIGAYAQTGNKEKATKHLKILIDETADYMQFFDSLDEEDRNLTWRSDIGFWNNTIAQIQQTARVIGDANLDKEINDKLGPYMTTTNLRN